MDIDKIKFFILTYQKGSFAAVAKDLNLASSSVSRAIAALEAHLKTRLFQRNTRTLSPTQEGTNYYKQVLPLIEELDSVHQSFIHGVHNPSGILRISASTTFGQIVLAPLLKSFSNKYPNIQLELSLSDNRVDLIEEQVDIAIRHGSLSDSSLVARKLKEVTYLLVASPEYLKSNQTIKSPEDLIQLNLVTFNYQEFAKQWHFSRKSVSKTITVQPFLKVSNAAMIRNCILNGMGVSLLADWTIEKDLNSGALVQILPDWRVSGENRNAAIWAVQPSRAFVPKKMTVFLEYLFEKLN